jgi:hypothetical protein
MNEAAAINVLYDLIDSNNEMFVDGLELNGEQRHIRTLSRTVMTPPLSFYAIHFHVASSFMRPSIGQAQVRNPVMEASYSASIFATDFAQITSGETSAFETQHDQFRVFTDRIAVLIKDQFWMTDVVTGLKFRLPEEKRIDKINTIQRYDQETAWPKVMVAVISFDLLQQCADDAGLY